MRRWTLGALPICASRSQVRSCWMPLRKLWPSLTGAARQVHAGSLRPSWVNLRHCTRTRTWGLVEGHADPILLAPDDVTGNVRAVRLKVETLGDVVGLGNLER